MSGLASVLAGHTAPGVYRWESALNAQELAGSFSVAGWDLAEAVTWSTIDKREVLRVIGVALGFPDYFGANLDALVDCLGDFDAERKVVLLWDGWGGFAEADPDSFATIVEIFGEDSTVGARLAVLLRGDGPEIGVPLLD